MFSLATALTWILMTYNFFMKYDTFTTVHIVSMDCLQEDKQREVLQYHYYDWPDEGVPRHSGGLINMIGEVEEIVKREDGGPVAVHCRSVIQSCLIL